MNAKRFNCRSVAGCCFVTLVVSVCATAAAQKPPPLPVDRLPKTLPLDVIPAGLDRKRPAPADNPLTPERVRLGRRLFFDPILSANRTVACASCHDPAHGFATASPKAVGILGRVGARNAPSLLNRAYGKSFFWDGRAASLEAQALQPIGNPRELGTSVAVVVKRLKADPSYQRQFAAAYQGEATAKNLARALASFQRVLLLGNSRVDRFQAAEAPALSVAEKAGLWIFESKGRCWRCHSGRNYTDEKFHNTGVSWGREPIDLGRFAVTMNAADRGAFKTPTLRGVAKTFPYMHDGSIATLKEVVEFYNRGGAKNRNLDPILAPLKLSPKEVKHLVAFLKALGAPERSSVENPPQ